MKMEEYDFIQVPTEKEMEHDTANAIWCIASTRQLPPELVQKILEFVRGPQITKLR